MVDFYQFLQQAQSASSTANWWLLIQCLQQLILGSEKTLVVMHQPELLELALVVLDAGSFDQRWQVSKLFRPLGTIAISPLSEILMDEDGEEELRWCASRILAEFD
ncbi:MAG: PBS lyase, partial [Nostocaceae cyanobacterium]|nr:PBS lyase [Nostocaceae cyanobacterium]